MLETACLIVGSLLAGGAIATLGSKFRPKNAREIPAPPPSEAVPAAPPAVAPARSTSTDAELDGPLARLEQSFAEFVVAESQDPLCSLASGIGRELADLATAVQGNAQLLCEVSSTPESIATRCEFLWSGVDRLRLLTEKVLTFAREARIECEPVDVRVFLDGLRRELETMHGDFLAVNIATSSFLPPARAHRRSLHNAMLFLVDTLLDLEPCTHCISICAYPDDSDDVASIGIEISAETNDDTGTAHQRKKRSLELGFLAAERSLAAQGAQLWLQQVENLTSTVFITLEAEVEAPEPPHADVAVEHNHEFGGVLVLEDNASIRSMITTEVERLGRKPLSCVDAASARVLLDATPERFELLVLEQDARNGDAVAIAREMAEARPDVKILLLGNVSTSEVGTDQPILRKPFGLLELRTALEGLLRPAASA